MKQSTNPKVQKSLHELDIETKTLESESKGDMAHDGNLTGSSTWVTLDDPRKEQMGSSATPPEASRR